MLTVIPYLQREYYSFQKSAYALEPFLNSV
nr:MAG TPA: hypothetical protein [Bacteriophage sp.]